MVKIKIFKVVKSLPQKFSLVAYIVSCVRISEQDV